MSHQYAEDFFDIPAVLVANTELREAVISLIQSEAMPGKVLEGGNRIEIFREILISLANGEIILETAYEQTERRLPRQTSPHSSSNRVFAREWAERQVRTQFSRFYNQAVLEQLRNQGVTTCFVPHSDAEASMSPCTQQLAGRQHAVEMLYQRLTDTYARGNWSKLVKIPDHPHCTHVVQPVE